MFSFHKKYILFLNITTFIATLLLGTASVQGMNDQDAYHEIINVDDIDTMLHGPSSTDLLEEISSLFNLLRTGTTPRTFIIDSSYIHLNDQTISLQDRIKTFMKLSATCKKLNTLLSFETIGKLCNEYAQNDKDETLKQLMKISNDLNYKAMRLPFLILVCAGANPNTKVLSISLLQKATLKDDPQLVTTLFKYHVNPNEIDDILPYPVFFDTREIKTITAFVNHQDFNIHATKFDGTNVLWHIVALERYSAELLEFYLTHNVDAQKLKSSDNSCLLHKLATNFFGFHIHDVNDFLKKGELLLGAMSKMVNTLNTQGKTPLDIAQESFEMTEYSKYNHNKQAFKQLIELYKNHGAVTSQQLKVLQRQATQKNITVNELLASLLTCSICLDTIKPTDLYTMSHCNGKSGCNVNFCKDCLLEHIATHVNQGSTHDLKCPNANCAKKMNESDIRTITENNKDLYLKFLDIAFEEFKTQNQNNIKSCPTPDCNCIYSIEGIDKTQRMQCPTCMHIYCMSCQYDHQYMSCEEAATRDHNCTLCATRHARNMSCSAAAKNRDQENTMIELSDQAVKPCPRCKTFIEKNKGCNHMTCKKCGHEFCWTCLSDYGSTGCSYDRCALFALETGINF